ncbi:pyrimidine reductase family protein [Mycobacterium sp. SM1]|uniref:pyrimidine reductase family protein n=1 Tax=Mycobacterium sp. SM1 TaxID=2816243 RepID=UPI001BCD080F|nr:pyrimidine reductase family protein [Mycobacterium sp. SM1]MBS4730041.1 pyrimidine reductase family protein [Mycobacterium sp. SM1]
MPDPDAGRAEGMPLTLLGAVRELDDGELLALYGYPAEHPGVWLRANVISSLDGGATVKGTTGGLGGPGDRRLFHLLRELADVILVGAGTVRVENYSGAHLSIAQRQHRQTRGQSEVPPLAIVTNSGRLDRDLPVFTRTEVAPLVLTSAAAATETRRRLAGLADVIACSGGDSAAVDEAVVRVALEERGLRRALTEGGPLLLGSLIERDLLDELCLTIAPVIVGGRAPRITTDPGQVLTRMRCRHVLADDAGYLYTRYVKVGR